MSYIFALYVVSSLAVIVYILWQARKDQQDLLDRIMALTDPNSLLLKDSITKPVEGDVEYIDERTEARLEIGATVDYDEEA